MVRAAFPPRPPAGYNHSGPMPTTTRTRVIGTTRLLEPLGKGGMAEVYSAIQEPLQRQVAVKIMLPELGKNREAVTRFRREALALASLSHENIVGIHDLVEKNGQLFMVMEYVEGVDVADLLKGGGPLPVDVALLVGAGVAGALEHAHFRKVIHRDVKPANVMISRFGEVKLTDFGIAKDMTIDDLTKTGLVVGTPAYLAPEQVTGKKPDSRTDLYALGILLFEALTGEKPFKAENHGQLFAMISDGKRRKVRRLRPEVPRAVEKLVDRCLQVKPEKRYQRAVDLRRDLDRLLDRLLLGTPSARLVTFMRDRGHVREDELSQLAIEDRWFVASGRDLATPVPTPSVEVDGAGRPKAGRSVAGAHGASLEIDLDASEVEAAPAAPVSTASAQVPALPARPRRRWLSRLVVSALVLAALLGAGTAAAWHYAPDETNAVLDQLARWAHPAPGAPRR